MQEEHDEQPGRSPDGAHPEQGPRQEVSAAPVKATSPQRTNPYGEALTKLVGIVVFALILVVWDLPRGLFLQAYTITHGKGKHLYRETNWRSLLLSILFSMTGGIAVGQTSWATGASVLTWLSMGSATAAVLFLFGWTVLYLVLIDMLLDWSGGLWKRVNLTGDSDFFSDHPPVWFTFCLLGISWIAAVVTAGYAGWQSMFYIQAHQETFGFLGWFAAVVAAIVILAGIGLILWAAGKSADGAGVGWTIVIGALLTWLFWGTIGPLFWGLFNNLTGSGPWGSWGYVIGGLGGLIVAVVVGAIEGFLIYTFGVAIVAAVTSLAAVYALGDWTNAVVALVPLGSLQPFSPVLDVVAYGIELFCFAGLAFPGLHIVITHGFLIADVWGMVKSVYFNSLLERLSDTLFLHLVNLTFAVVGVIFFPGMIAQALGTANPWSIYSLTGVATAICYLCGYKLLAELGPLLHALAVGSYVGHKAFQFYVNHGWPFGTTGAWIACGISGFTFVLLVVPALCLAVRRTNRWRAAIWLRDRLDGAYDAIVSGLHTFWSRLFDAAEEAYSDTTPFRGAFLHLINIVVALAVLAGTLWAGLWLQFESLALVGTIAVVLAAASYLFTGNALLRYGVWPLSIVVSAVIGIACGVLAFHGQPVGWAGWRLGLALFFGLLGATAALSVILPWPYVWLKWLFSRRSFDARMEKRLAGWHQSVWLCFARPLGRLREQIKQYRRIYNQIWETVARWREQFSFTERGDAEDE